MTLEAVRRLAVVGYLTAIALGLTVITTVLRYQAVRLRDMSEEVC